MDGRGHWAGDQVCPNFVENRSGPGSSTRPWNANWSRDVSKTDHHNQKDGSRETQKLDPCWKLRPVVYMVNTELKLESGL